MSVSKIVAAAASSAGGAGLDVDEVFSTTLYSGTNANQTITNGIDLSGEGGLVWTKARDYGVGHGLVDTVRGNTKYLEANGADAEATTSVGITAFNSTGYNLGADTLGSLMLVIPTFQNTSHGHFAIPLCFKL